MALVEKQERTTYETLRRRGKIPGYNLRIRNREQSLGKYEKGITGWGEKGWTRTQSKRAAKGAMVTGKKDELDQKIENRKSSITLKK